MALGGKWHARCGTAPCPICQPERRRDQDALTLSDATDRRPLAHCNKAGCSFRDLAAALGLSFGTFTKPDPMERAKRKAEQWDEATTIATRVAPVWREALPFYGDVPRSIRIGGCVLFHCEDVQASERMRSAAAAD